MCNRYQLNTTAELMAQRFALERVVFTPGGDVIAGEYFPRSRVPIIRQSADVRELVGATWGIDLGRPVTNSRDDKVDRTWRRFMHRRVVFPMDRAIEYRYELDMLGQAYGKPKPWVLFPADGSIAAVAGIAGRDMAEVSMMTTAATGIAAEVHNKKPEDPRVVVFLVEDADVDRWLDPDVAFDDVRDLLRGPPDGWLDAVALV